GGVGYIVIDGSAVALGTLSENGLKVHHHENVDIPKKHGRGGQSAPRFQRIRLEKRQLLVKKVIALSEDYFLNENKATVQVQALVVGGPGQLKDQLVERLPQLLKSAGGVGYIVIDGSAVALGTLSENGLKVHHHENVDIPKKHGRGGQSAPRFQRIRLEKRQLLVKKVIALSEDYFLNENKATVQVQALVVGGPGQLKDQLVERLPQLLKSA
ncbi:eukaryotic peptide chain release factor subunit 1-like, partial [Homarus americanus]|uniref:eukaryotic peptide chain release factor subunit 1-like n=1 Tax=Homarus americanus TaxID=6706 RepID=UPI001C484EB6